MKEIQEMPKKNDLLDLIKSDTSSKAGGLPFAVPSKGTIRKR
jgi:hypothetical protein